MNKEKVTEIGSFLAITQASVMLADENMKKRELEREKKERRKKLLQMNQYNSIVNEEETREMAFDTNNGLNENRQEKIEKQMETVQALLVKAGIPSKVFPFKVVKDKEGNLDFIPKGKNEKEINENIRKYKEELQKALEKGKITQEEYEELNQNLEDIMGKKGIELEGEELDIEISDDEIEENLDQLIAHNFGNEKVFEDLCKEYEEYDLDERKNCLQEFNSKINTQLGIAGNLSFSTNPNLEFENSFTKDGFMLTEKQVSSQNLKPVLYTMMEKSLMRQKEIQMGQKIEASKKKQMHEKIMEERKRKYEQYKEKEDRKLGEKTRKRMRNMWNG